MGLRGHRATGTASTHTLRFLVAGIGLSHFAFPADWVRGIVTPSEAGGDVTVTWARATYERTDLAVRLTRKSLSQSVDSRIVLYGNDQRARAFLVDQVVGLVDVLRHDIRPLPPHFRGGERERIIGFFMDPEYIALITNPFWILDLPSGKDLLTTLVTPASSDGAPRTKPLLQLTTTEHHAALTSAARPQ